MTKREKNNESEKVNKIFCVLHVGGDLASLLSAAVVGAWQEEQDKAGNLQTLTQKLW